MKHFPIHTLESAPETAKPILQSAASAFGFLPNLLGGMAQAPALLEGYLTLMGIFNRTSLTETERQIVLMTSNRLNGCTYCMAAHTTLSQMAKVPEDVIEALRSGTVIADPKLEALRQFAISMVESRGWPSEADQSAFFAAGYTPQAALEVVLGTALKVMSNYTNHIVETPLDAAFSENAWAIGADKSRV